MKVGQYARTKNCNMPSLIGKIIKEEYMTPCNAEHKYIYLIDDTKDNLWFEEDNILKSSPNIIDLIEVRDYVNGCMVINKKDDIIQIIQLILPFDLKEKDIKSIVTHEQFESMQYNLESEVN